MLVSLQDDHLGSFRNCNASQLGNRLYALTNDLSADKGRRQKIASRNFAKILFVIYIERTVLYEDVVISSYCSRGA